MQNFAEFAGPVCNDFVTKNDIRRRRVGLVSLFFHFLLLDENSLQLAGKKFKLRKIFLKKLSCKIFNSLLSDIFLVTEVGHCIYLARNKWYYYNTKFFH